jgi:hypothetical protein
MTATFSDVASSYAMCFEFVVNLTMGLQSLVHTLYGLVNLAGACSDLAVPGASASLSRRAGGSERTIFGLTGAFSLSNGR